MGRHGEDAWVLRPDSLPYVGQCNVNAMHGYINSSARAPLMHLIGGYWDTEGAV